MLRDLLAAIRMPVCFGLLFLAGACGGSTTPTPPPPPPPPPAPVPTTIAVEAGNQQSAPGGEPVSVAPAVVVRDQQGRPLAGATVTFSVTEGAGSVEGATPATDNSGIARVTRWTLGPSGAQQLSARVGSLDPVAFQATILPGTELLDVAISPGGGSFEISQAGHPLRGFRLTVASGILEAPTTWRFRVASSGSAPTLPSGYQVAGPMLEVVTEQPRANGLMILDVPMSLGPNQGGVVALYDPARRIIDVLPTVARTSSSLRVVTRHLRADFLAGPSQPARAPAATSAFLGGGLLMPIAFPLPMPDVPLLIDPESDRWPVLEHGSALAPDGHGPAIAGFEALNLALKGPAFASFIKGLAEPGFYAEPAPLGALLIAAKRLTEGLGRALKDLNEELRKLPKAERDELVSQTMNATLAMRGATPVAFASATDEQMAFAMGGGITASGLSVVTSALKGVLVVGKTPAGFESQSVSPTVDSPPKVADGVLPLSGLILAFDRLGDILAKLQSLPTIPPEARALVNQALAREAGLPEVELEAQVGSDGGWVGLTANKLIRRVKAVTIRMPTIVAGMMLHIPTGPEMARSTEPRLDLAPVAPLNELPPLTPTKVVLSPFARIAGKFKQMTAAVIDVVRADFVVAPERVTLGGDRKVSFEAAVPEPPVSGYRIRWEWGDGKTTENLGLPAANHTYDSLGSYRVVATLLTQPAGKVLGVDTVMVDRPEPVPYWRIETIADPDSLFAPEPPETELGRLYQRLLLEPKSTLIAIEDVGGGGSVVRLRVLPTSTWSLTSCCPPATPLPGELRVSHGVKPPTVATFGAAFAAWTRSEWSQTSESLDTGTLTGRFVIGSTTYSMESGGTQIGPTGVTRIEATRSGDRMNGTLFLTAWSVDEETGFVDTEPTTWRLPFTAVRIQ